MAASLEEYMAKKYSGEKKRKRKEEKASHRDAGKDLVLKESEDDNGKESASKRVKQTEEPHERAGRWLSVETNTEVPVPDEEAKTENEEKPERKRKGGLQSHEQITEELAQKEEKMRRELQSLKELGAHLHTTVHRDASGRKLTDEEVRRAREDGRRKVDEKGRKKLVEQLNRDEAGAVREKQKKERLRKIKDEGINVYENDPGLVKSRKEAIMSEDPALLFDKGVIDKHEKEMEKQFVSITGRKLYKNVGHYPMNRFNIKPGWRWDGIVRGNGFEKKWHDAQVNKK